MSVASLSVLTPGTMNFGISGRGGKPELTRAEMAALLSGLSAVATHYALAKYCADSAALRLLQLHCIQVAAGYAANYGWKANKGKPCIVSLGVLAAIESVDSRMCFSCNSVSMAGDKVCSCVKPRSGVSVVDRARYVDISREQWRTVWAFRYEYLFDYCQMLDSQISHAIRNNY